MGSDHFVHLGKLSLKVDQVTENRVGMYLLARSTPRKTWNREPHNTRKSWHFLKLLWYLGEYGQLIPDAKSCFERFSWHRRNSIFNVNPAAALVAPVQPTSVITLKIINSRVELEQLEPRHLRRFFVSLSLSLFQAP